MKDRQTLLRAAMRAPRRGIALVEAALFLMIAWAVIVGALVFYHNAAEAQKAREAKKDSTSGDDGWGPDTDVDGASGWAVTPRDAAPELPDFDPADITVVSPQERPAPQAREEQPLDSETTPATGGETVPPLGIAAALLLVVLALGAARFGVKRRRAAIRARARQEYRGPSLSLIASRIVDLGDATGDTVIATQARAFAAAHDTFAATPDHHLSGDYVTLLRDARTINARLTDLDGREGVISARDRKQILDILWRATSVMTSQALAARDESKSTPSAGMSLDKAA